MKLGARLKYYILFLYFTPYGTYLHCNDLLRQLSAWRTMSLQKKTVSFLAETRRCYVKKAGSHGGVGAAAAYC